MNSQHVGKFVMDASEQFSVRVCDCGLVHMHFGATAITATPKVVRDMSITLNEVTEELNSRQPQEPHLKLIETNPRFMAEQLSGD